MVKITTDLGITLSDARRIRFEKAGTNTATNVEQAIINAGGGGGGGTITVGTTPIASGTSGRLLYDNGALVGELALGVGIVINSGVISWNNARTQRSITVAGNLPLIASDSILNINAATDLTPVILLASGRGGTPFTIKNLPGSHIQTLQRTSPDTFDGLTTYILNPGSSVTLVPYNDGVNAGYAIE